MTDWSEFLDFPGNSLPVPVWKVNRARGGEQVPVALSQGVRYNADKRQDGAASPAMQTFF